MITLDSVAKITIKDIIRKDAGKYSITGENTVGTKTITFSIIVMERPSPPIGPIEIREIAADYAIIAWSQPEEDGGAPVSHYIIDKHDMNIGWVESSGFVTGNVYKITRLTKGVEYVFRVRAANRFGISDPLESARTIANHPFKRPTIPGTPKATMITKEMVCLAWQEPTINGGSPILGYHVEYKDTSAILWTKANCYLVKENCYKVKNLTPGLCYEFRVTAENIAGKLILFI